MRELHFKEQHPNGAHHEPCMERGLKQGCGVQVSGQRENPKEKVHLKNFKVMSSVFNSTFRRYQRSEVDLEDLHHFVTAVVVIISLENLLSTYR